MNFKIGERVRFLNEKGEGIIRGIDKQFATVEIEEGFDIPFLIAELVKIHEPGQVSHRKPELAEIHKFVFEQPETVKISNTISEAVKGQDVCLAFVPENENRLLSGPLLVYLVNNTKFQLVYSYSISKNNEDVGIGAGLLHKNTEVFLHTMNRHEIEKLSGVFIQLLFHNNIGFKARHPVQERLVLKSAYFSNLDKLRPLESISKHAFILPVYKEDPLPLKSHDNSKIKDKIKSGYRSERNSFRSVESIFKALNNELEVDLHIEELTSHFSGMSNAEIVMMQLAHFHKCMDKAISSHVHRIIFIHGVGNGTLKKALREELKGYKGIKVEDGSYDKYGSGATQVLFLQ
jgi:hypothetical protein